MTTTQAQKATAIEVRERSETSISAVTLLSLQGSRSVGRLIEGGIIGLTCGKRGWALRGNHFVGQAILEDGTRLRVLEKADGALESLLASAMPSDVRRERLVSAPCGEGGAIAFVSGFLQSLDNAMRRGRHKQWCAVRELSLTPRGILDVPETMAIRARGRRPYIAQRVPRVTANTDVNRLLKLALLICDRWARAQAVLSPKIVAAVRGYLPLFADVDATVLARTARRLLAHLFCSAIGDRTISPETRQALIYARTIVLQTLTGDGGGLLDEALFWDLETLFESAVRNAVTKSPLLLGGNVFDGKDHPRVVFVDNQSRFRACPDVVARQGDRHIFVSDCKYVDIKDAELSKHGHVYQLLAHASAYAAKESCLFYPGSAFGAERVGITRDGVRVHAFTLRVSELVKDVHEALRHVLTQESPAGPA